MNSPVRPRFQIPPPLPVPTKPGVVSLYRVWCGLFIALWLGMLIYSVFKARGEIEDLGPITEWLVKDDQSARDAVLAEERRNAVGVAAIAALLMLFYGFAACVPRKPWGWIVGFIALIGTAFPFCVPLAVSIPLLLSWVKPAAKSYFGMQDRKR